jgi:putative endonuclease
MPQIAQPNWLSRIGLDAQRSALLHLRSLAKTRSAPHLQVGLRGEFEALFYLRFLGFTVVERRWRSPEHNGDLDLIAWEGETLVIIEVKTRSTRDLTPAALAVDDTKRRMLRRMASSYVRTLPHQYRDALLLRFDIVSVYLTDSGTPECELLRDIDVRA